MLRIGGYALGAVIAWALFQRLTMGSQAWDLWTGPLREALAWRICFVFLAGGLIGASRQLASRWQRWALFGSAVALLTSSVWVPVQLMDLGTLVGALGMVLIRMVPLMIVCGIAGAIVGDGKRTVAK